MQASARACWRFRWHCLQPLGASCQVNLFLLTKQYRAFLAAQCEFSLKLSVLRFGTLLVLAATALSGCSINADSFKDCKNKDGKPLPQWICNDTRKENSD